MGKVKFKCGTFEAYMLECSNYQEDPESVPGFDDKLYFITDRGLIYKGIELVTHQVDVELVSPVDEGRPYVRITDRTAYPDVVTRDVYLKNSVDALMNAHNAVIGNGNLDEHGEAVGFGHVALTDVLDNGKDEEDHPVPTDADAGVAATPKAVKKAIFDLKESIHQELNQELSAIETYLDGPLSQYKNDVVAHGEAVSFDDETESFEVVCDQSRPNEGFKPEQGGLIAIHFGEGLKFDFGGVTVLKAGICGKRFGLFHRGGAGDPQPIDAKQILPGDTATFFAVHSGEQDPDGEWKLLLLTVDRKIDYTVTEGSDNYITSGAVHSAIADAAPEWEEINP